MKLQNTIKSACALTLIICATAHADDSKNKSATQQLNALGNGANTKMFDGSRVPRSGLDTSTHAVTVTPSTPTYSAPISSGTIRQVPLQPQQHLHITPPPAPSVPKAAPKQENKSRTGVVSTGR